jgi:4-diphosphocytidyl-2C-methyl-D-erythritol kinase
MPVEPPAPPEQIVLSAPAKVTLSLRVTSVRADGYHLIDAAR